MIREYKESDYGAMREFYFQVLFESRHFLPYTPTLNKGFFNAENRFNYVIGDNDIVAHVTIVKVNDDVYSVGLAVLKSHWGNRYGTELLKFAENTIKEMGGKMIKASIHTDNWRSIILFTNNGFKVTNEDNNLCLEKEL